MDWIFTYYLLLYNTQVEAQHKLTQLKGMVQVIIQENHN